MRTQFIRTYVLAAVLLLAATAARGQSAYSNAVMNLNPVAYWPLQETAQPPMADVETNLGSLGPIANAYYASTNAARGAAGAIAGDTDAAVNFLGNSSSFAIVPTTDHRVSLPAGNKAFTVECWTRATVGQNYRGIITQTGPNNSGGLNGVNNSFGWSLNLEFAPYRGTGGNNAPHAWTFHVFNGYGFTGGAEAEAANDVGWLTGVGVNGYTNSWVYLAGVFDGTNCWLYVYSTNLDNASYGGTNLMNVTGAGDQALAQLPITTAPGAPVGGIDASNIVGAAFSPDTWDPIMLGCTRGWGGNPFIGSLDEVAIYTNALTSEQIASHFIAGTNGLGNYSATVIADHPYMYWRMDAPRYTWPAASSFPTAANYGSVGASMTNFNTLGTSAVYQPGTLPGVDGPSYPGFGNLTKACAFNGIVGAVDAGYNAGLDPTGYTNFTLVAWFKANPWDYSSRWLCLASHSDQSWKAQFKTGTIYGHKGAGSQAQIAPATINVNDDKWHMYVLESIYTNGVCTNVSISLDGAVTATLANTAATPGKPTMDAFIGGAPEAGYTQPTNGQYNANQQYFPGRVAHVSYFNYALSPAQLQDLYFTANPMSPPLISKQPVSAAVDQGKAFTNTVMAVSPVYPLSYQWYKNGAPLATQTSASLILNPVLMADQGTNYFVVVTNTYGAVTSAVVSLTVRGVPLLTAQLPISHTNPITLYGGSSPATFGSSPTFSVSASGVQPLSYQWRTNGVAMAGATNTSLTFTNCQMTSPTSFQCVITNLFGSVTATWSVIYAPAPTAPFPQAVLAAQPRCYWRLNEPDDGLGDGNPGAICTDYQSANNGLYTNVFLGNSSYNTLTDPTETSASFGYPSPSIASWIGSSIDFSAPSGSNAAFTVAVWANGNGTVQLGNAGLVTKGAWAAEQFTLDEGAANSALRFTVRNASGANYYSASSSFLLGSDAAWHFVVGVCDEPHGTLSLYVDGRLVGSASLPAGSGILSSAEPVTIGARKGGGGTYNNQFWGYLSDVAVYNYALSPDQVVQQYVASGVAPIITQQPPANTNVSAGSTVVVTAGAIGTSPLSYRWYDETAGAYMDGQTSPTLVLNNVTSSGSYHVTVSNAYGSVDSASVSVTVFLGLPQIYTDVKNPFYGFAGQSAANSVVAYGTLPLSYQWQFYNGATWVNLVDNGRISGSQSNILTIASLSATDAGSYRVIVSNGSGPTTSGSAALTVCSLPLAFTSDGSLWKANGSARIANSLLSLTDPNNGGGTGSFFFQYPQYIGAFQASFTYQAGGNRAADGISFCLQNDPRGAAAMGTGGGQLGVGSTAGTQITPSAELEMNIFGTVGYAFGTNGIVPGGGAYTAPGSVDFKSGNPIDVTVTYLNGQVALTFADATAGTSYSTNLAVGDLTGVLGADTAYVGFTGAYGGSTSVQTITNLSFVSIPPQTIQIVGANAVISWPGAVEGFVLQRNSDLSTANWVDVTSADNLVNGQHQVVEPLGSANQFYRLILKP